MSDMLSAVRDQVISAYHTVASTSVSLGTKAYNFGGRVVTQVSNVVTPKLQAIASKVQQLFSPTVFQTIWKNVRANPGVTALLLTATVTALVLANKAESKMHKYALRTVAVAGIVFCAVAATTPVVNTRF